jgi:hypothetical protein
MINISPEKTKRGFDPEDPKWFSKEAVKHLRIAQAEIQWLLDRGYKEGPVIDFIGGHYQLSSRQRIALKRSVSSTSKYEKKISTKLPLTQARDGRLNIDGFNLIIALEVALSGSILVFGRDGVPRDLAGLRGSYKIIEQTDQALELIGKVFHQLFVPEVKFFLDSPVSNSGRLKNRILEHAKNWGMPVEIELLPNVDTVLSTMERVVTGDSIILGNCKSWFNLSREIIENAITDAWIVNFEE